MRTFTVRSVQCKVEWAADSAVFGYGYSPSIPEPSAIARDILVDVMQLRRFSGSQTSCITSPCQKCLAPHLSKIISAVALGLPVTFVLPAFPGKSPNPAKVLGPLPDMAERRALEFLQQLCDRVRRYYSPGARVILCSDGRVFSDVVGMHDEDVTAYRHELFKMIVELGLSSISTFNLDELYDGLSFDQMRAQLMEQHGVPIDALQAAVRRGGTNQDCSPYSSEDDQEAHRLYCGITRFLLEDAMFPGQKKSRTALQKDCRNRAYEVIQRSKAWGDLVEMRFPNAVRLSIHPQACGAKKLGIRLIEPDNWLTPWHGVAVEVGGRFMLLKRSQAEELGASLVHRDGRPSHYVLPLGSDVEKELSKLHLTGAKHGTSPEVQNEA
ncbi:MAG: isocyanide synthase family protein [Bdellovibrionia bacterium]